jgi:hypothetical protein
MHATVPRHDTVTVAKLVTNISNAMCESNMLVAFVKGVILWQPPHLAWAQCARGKHIASGGRALAPSCDSVCRHLRWGRGQQQRQLVAFLHAHVASVVAVVSSSLSLNWFACADLRVSTALCAPDVEALGASVLRGRGVVWSWREAAGGSRIRLNSHLK